MTVSRLIVALSRLQQDAHVLIARETGFFEPSPRLFGPPGIDRDADVKGLAENGVGRNDPYVLL